ncbi:hypothetical protein [Paracoccus benzoatiresistens]|uniref:Uncharacterized protein n=1 Tax=Paracoccus benzoatiresistens TaxID=2997341 RepID=A0ABT4JBZ4_9RHOB|nr:hypothetical protein [Paracoccus sp. EF6]MCZ0964092.1 hypothetical protein [Paracoccus sp. EF6]
MARTTGWSTKDVHLVGHVLFGHWHPQTFIAAPHHHRLEVPQVIDGAMDRELFEHHVETRLDQTPRRCDLITDVITRDNLSLRESPKATAAVSAIGGWFLLFPPTARI